MLVCPRRGSQTDVLLDSFERYLLTERSLAAGTAGGYVRHAARFLVGLSPSGLADVTAADVTRAVLRESGAVSVSATQNFVAGLRALLRFCFVEGLMHVDLSQAALPVTGRRRSALPQGITQAEARALLESCDRRSALGRRDYALIITLLRLGLRRSEVGALRAIPANPAKARACGAHARLGRAMVGAKTATSAPRASSQARVGGEKYAQV